jgi:hypothetical protein
MAITGATFQFKFQYDPTMVLPRDEAFLNEMGGEKLDWTNSNRDHYKPFLFKFTFYPESWRWQLSSMLPRTPKAPILAIGVHVDIAKFDDPYAMFIKGMRERGVIFGPVPISFVPMEPGPFSDDEAVRSWLERVSPPPLVKSANKTGPDSLVRDE